MDERVLEIYCWICFFSHFYIRRLQLFIVRRALQLALSLAEYSSTEITTSLLRTWYRRHQWSKKSTTASAWSCDIWRHGDVTAGTCRHKWHELRVTNAAPPPPAGMQRGIGWITVEFESATDLQKMAIPVTAAGSISSTACSYHFAFFSKYDEYFNHFKRFLLFVSLHI